MDANERRRLSSPTTNEDTAAIRKALKAYPALKRISVRHGRGTAYCWVDISGSGEYGAFSPSERDALTALGLHPGLNFCGISPDERTFWREKLTAGA